jgi:hypothetical protein
MSLIDYLFVSMDDGNEWRCMQQGTRFRIARTGLQNAHDERRSTAGVPEFGINSPNQHPQLLIAPVPASGMPRLGSR